MNIDDANRSAAMALLAELRDTAASARTAHLRAIAKQLVSLTVIVQRTVNARDYVRFYEATDTLAAHVNELSDEDREGLIHVLLSDLADIHRNGKRRRK